MQWRHLSFWRWPVSFSYSAPCDTTGLYACICSFSLALICTQGTTEPVAAVSARTIINSSHSAVLQLEDSCYEFLPSECGTYILLLCFNILEYVRLM
ncbi:hypothetical protein EV421DRAFT_1213438 [Armillaria borealis]|uniref:Secreted protein n=1 Tax=Armillaria borealis TaxID=47425 RepID=A0AA39J442_9AGAR|nr:hypothetical protein EV421DRAFT_1213438 [Armillaria borealis]